MLLNLIDWPFKSGISSKTLNCGINASFGTCRCCSFDLKPLLTTHIITLNSVLLSMKRAASIRVRMCVCVQGRRKVNDLQINIKSLSSGTALMDFLLFCRWLLDCLNKKQTMIKKKTKIYKYIWPPPKYGAHHLCWFNRIFQDTTKTDFRSAHSATMALLLSH